MRIATTLRALVLTGISLAACSDGPAFPYATPGRDGVLGFAFSGNFTEECFNACKVDRSIAVGAMSHINITEGDPTRRFTARVPDTVDLEFSNLFFCEPGDGTFREVELGQTCNEGEELTALRIAKVFPTQVGSFSLEVLDQGELVDSIELDVRPVVGARFMEAADPEIIEELTVAEGDTNTVQPIFAGEDDTTIHWNDFELEWTSADPTVATVQEDPPNPVTFGSALVIGVGPGQTDLRLHALGIEIVLPVTVE